MEPPLRQSSSAWAVCNAVAPSLSVQSVCASVGHFLHYLPCRSDTSHLTSVCCHLQGISNVSVQSSVSLQHLPYDVKLEKKLPSEIESRLSFATQKLKEIVDAAAQAPKLKDEDIKAALPVCESCPQNTHSWWRLDG